MPDKKYLIEIPGMPDGSGIWDADKWERNKDSFMQDYPDANVYELGEYDAEDALESDQIMLSFEGDEESSGIWDSAKWERNKDAFLQDYPDARVDRVRYVDYWGDAAERNRARREELSQPDAERDARLAAIGYFDDISGEKVFDVNDPMQAGLKPVSSAIKQNSVSGETEYLDPKVAEFYANDSAYTERLAERERLDAEYEQNPQVIAQREYEAELAKYAANLENQIRSDMDADVDSGKVGRGMAGKRVSGKYGMSPYIPTKEEYAEVEKYEKYTTALKLLEKAKIARDVAGKGFGGAVIDWAKEGVMDASTQSDIEAYNEIGNILTRLQKEVGNLKSENITEEVFDKYLSKDEQALIKSFFEYNSAMADAQQDMSRAYKGGKIFAESIPFMLEFLATGGLYKSAGRVATRGLERALVSWISKSARNTAARTAKKVVTAATRDALFALAGTTARTLVTPGTYNRMAEASVEIDQETGELNRVKNATIAAADMYVENLSEISGGLIGKGLGLLGKGAGKLIAKTPLSKIGEMVSDNRLMQSISGFMPKLEVLGFNGLPEEIGEEFIGNAIREVTGIQPGALKEMVADDNFGAMLIGFAPMTLLGAAGGAVNLAIVNAKAAQLGKDMRERFADRYSAEELDHMMGAIHEAQNAEEIQQALKPMALAISDSLEKGMITAEEASAELEMLYQYGGFVAQNNALLFGNKVQDRQLMDAKREEFTGQYGRFWQEDESETVQIATLNNGNTVFVTSTPAEDGMVATVDVLTGKKGFANTSDIATEEVEGEEVQSSNSMTMDAFLNGQIAMQRKTAEETRMTNERNAQIDALRSQITPGTKINLGTEGSPVFVFAKGTNKQGVVIVDETGMESTLGWEQAADAMGQPIIVETDQQKLDEEISARLQRMAERRMKRAVPSPTEQATIEAAEQEAEIVEQEQRHIPLNEDGTVNEAAFWTQDPEGYAKWNDEQNQDGGQDSLRQIAISKQELIGMYSEVVAGQNTSNPTMRKAAEKEARIIADKIARLEALEQSYMTALEQEKIAVQQTAATPTASMGEEQLEQMDAQYQGILGKTRVPSERVRVMQEYLNKLAEGSVPVVLLTKQNYEEQMKADNLPEVMIKRVRKEVEAGRAVAGFMAAGKVYLMSEGVSSINEARVTYVHERQHTFNKKNPELLKRVVDALENKENALAVLKAFVDEYTLESYKDDDINALADEIICRSMEIAYTTEEFSLDLQSLGVPSEVISIITEINNEQRKDQSLSHARRRRGRITNDNVPGAGSTQEDGRDIEQISGGVLDNQETRPSGSSGRGTQTGEGAEVISEEQLNAPNSGTAQQIAAADGEVLADTDGKGGVRFSIRTWNEGGRDYLAAWLANDTTLTEDEKADILARMDEFYQNALLYSDTYVPFGTWSEAGVRYDNNGNPLMSVIKANGDYAMNLDFSLVCKKRRPLNRLLRTLINRNAFGTYSLKEREIAEINWILQEHGFEVACALCFVDSKRYRVTGVADVFAALYNKMVKTLAPEGAAIAHFNYNGNPNVEVVENGIDTMADEQLNWAAFEKYAKRFKPTSVEGKVAQLLREKPSQRRLVDATDFIEAEGFEAVKANNQELLKLYNAKKGTGGPKASFGDVQYLNDILKKEKSFDVDKAYAVGGVRIQSFSDFVPHMYFDYMQLFAELAAKKLPAHAYTKEVLFAKIFGLTGLKINLSLVPAVVEGGIAPGLDAEGNYAWADAVRDAEGNIIQQAQTFPFDEAMAIQNAEGYSKNCGAIAVGISDEHIEKMLDDPNIQFIIPYHKSSLNAIVARMTNIDQYKDYTNVQTTKKASGTKLDKGTKDFNFNEALHNLGENGTPQQAAQMYLDWCKENNFRPKFSQFAYHPNYYKLLVDFNTVDTTTGEYAPQGAVTMSFPTEQNAFGNVETLIEQGLGEDMALEEKLEAEVDEIANEVEERLAEIAKEPKLTEKQQLEKMAELADERAAQIKARSEGPIDLVEEAKKAQAKHDAKAKKGTKKSEVSFRITPRTDEQREKLFEDAKAHYGVTQNFNAAGYMLPDGSLLDFSEANDGGDPNSRSLDHRDIGRVINDREYESRYEYVTDFVNEGAIRMLPEYAGFQLSQAPTAEQRSKLMDYIYKFNGEVIMEITDENGSPKVYMEYNKRTSPSRIFNDMDGYFNDGTIPGIPPIRFRVTEEQRDEVQFRVISDALYEEMDDMIESLVGASFFRRVESEFDLGKKVKNFEEFADLITIIKNNNNYISTGSSLLGFFSSHTDQHFPLLLSVDDKALRKQAEADLKEALSRIDDTYILFYIKEAWKAHKNGLAQAGLGVKPNATAKFNKAIDARIEEIRAGRVKGTSFNFKKQEVSLDEIDTLFKQLNANEELAVLHDKVMDLAKRFGIKPQFAAIRGAAEGESLGDKVRYDYRAFNSPAISDERKANIITHELIHSVTSYAFYLDDYMPSALTPEMRDAINILREVYYAIRRDSSFKDEYGASSVEEMVAELSNTAFREKLKEKSLYQRILDAILKLFGVVKEDSAYNAANEALTYIIENYDENAFNLYARQAARSQEYSKWYNSEDVRFRMSNENQAIFVSNAAKAVEGIKQEKATPEQWLKMIEKNGGLKAGEDKWMGLSDWLKASDKKTLTKQEVLDFINENMIVIEEQHYGDIDEEEAIKNTIARDFARGHSLEELQEMVDENAESASRYDDEAETEDFSLDEWLMERMVEEFGEDFSEHYMISDGYIEYIEPDWWDRDNDAETLEDEKGVRQIHSMRESYTTRGLRNNHEIALTIPTIESWGESDMVHFGDAGEGRAIAWIRFGETTTGLESNGMRMRSRKLADELEKKYGSMWNSDETYEQMSEEDKAKRDEADRLYHLSDVDAEWIENKRQFANRMAERGYTEAAERERREADEASRLWSEYRAESSSKKVLVIDEIQSKRHQEGREKGYARGPKVSLAELKQQAQEFENRMIEKYNPKDIGLIPFASAMRGVWTAEEENAYSEIMSALGGAAMKNIGIPDAPFDKNWHELAMKRMLRYAAENGYDVIAWTTGDQQASRYDLSKMVKKISVYPSKDGSRIVDLHLVDRENDFKNLVVDSEGMVTFGEYKGRALADVVGKDYSMKIMAATRNTEFSGDNLKVGGEGMRGFYDKMLPAFMNKYGKKWGVKVEDIDLPNLGRYGYTMHSVPVTEEMKASVMEGQVMFRMRGENETAMEFHRAIVDEHKSKYNDIAEIEVFPVNEATAKRFGYTLDELRKLSGLYVSSEDLIAIFAKEDETDSTEIEDTIFHESVHKLADYFDHLKEVGEWMWSVADNYTIFAELKKYLEQEYEEGEYAEEMMCHMLGYTMSSGRVDELLSSMPESVKKNCEQIFNEIGYDRTRESIARVLGYNGESAEVSEVASEESGADEGRRSRKETKESTGGYGSEIGYDRIRRESDSGRTGASGVDAEGVQMRNTDASGESAEESARAGLTAEERRVINEYFPGAFPEEENDTEPDNAGEFSEGEGDIRFSIRTKPAPKKTGVGYKVFYLKDGRLYPPMVANQGGVDTPVGVWLDAEEGTRAGESKTGRPQVKQGGKGTQGGSGKLAYRPGWHLGEIPYALQFNRKDESGEKTLFPADFVWAEVEYANDVDYQEEAMSYGYNANGKFQHSLAGLPKLPTDGSYRYRTNPNPETDPWIITGAMKVNRLLTPSEVDQMVIDAGREPQKRQSGAVTDEQIEALNKELGLTEETGVSFRVNENPTDAQKEAGNYKMGHLNLDGYRITIENPKGSVRRGTDSNGNAWENTLNNDYGYIRGTEGVDGDHIDVYLSDNPSEGNVFVIDQVNPSTREFDEHKVMYGFNSAEEAREAYLANFSEGWNGLGTITEVTKDEFKKWVESSHRKTKPFSEYKSVKAIGAQSEVEEAEDDLLPSTGTPTDEVVASGLDLSPAQTATLAGNIFAALPEDSRKRITEGLNGNILGLQEAILQIPTSLASKENWDEEDRQMADIVREKVQDVVDSMSGPTSRPLTSKEALWMLHRSDNPTLDLVTAAKNAIIARNLGFDPASMQRKKEEDDYIRFSIANQGVIDAATDMYNYETSLWTERLKESWLDMNQSVVALQSAMADASGMPIEPWENIVYALNRLSSKSYAAKKKYLRDFLKPLWDAVIRIMKHTDFKIEDIERYMMLKHALERNMVFAKRDAREFYRGMYDEVARKMKSQSHAEQVVELSEAKKALADIDAQIATATGAKLQRLQDERINALYRVEVANLVLRGDEKQNEDDLKNYYDAIDAELDPKYLEFREKDYGGLTSMYTSYGTVNRSKYKSEEAYQKAVLAMQQPIYDNVADMESAARMEVDRYEQNMSPEARTNLWDKVNAATKETLRHQYESGMLTIEQYEAVRDMFEFYIPLRGFADNTAEDMYSYYMNNSSNGFSMPVIGAKGRTTRAESPLGWIGNMAESAIQADNKNEAKMCLYYAVLRRPGQNLLSITETWFEYTGKKDANGKKIYAPAYPPATNKALNADELRQHMEDWEDDMKKKQASGNAFKGTQSVNLRGSVVFQEDKQEKEHIIRVKVAGKDYSILINGNPRAAQAINGLLNPEANVGPVGEWYGNIRRSLSSLLTSFSPLFWVANYQRDLLSSFMRTSESEGWGEAMKYLNNRRKAWRVASYIYKYESGELGDSYYENLYKEFAENGGITGYTALTTNKEYEKLLADYAKSVDKPILESVKSAWDKFMGFGEAIEQVSRFAAYITAREAGKSIEEAVNSAKEVSVNFNRKGSANPISLEELDKLRTKKGKELNVYQKGAAIIFSAMPKVMKELYFFFNASVQALSSSLKLARKSPGKAAAWAGAYFGLSIAMAMINYLLSGDDDEEYLDLPDYLRHSTLLIKVSDNYYIKWSLPQEMRPFYAWADVLVSKMMGKMPHKNVGMEMALAAAQWLPVNPFEAEDFLLSLVPDVASPFAEVIANKTSFGGKIYDDMSFKSEGYKSGIPAYRKATEKTGKVYVELSELLNDISGGDDAIKGKININPAIMEHLVEGYGGGIYDFAKMMVAFPGMLISEDPVEIKNVPFVNKVVMSVDETNMYSHTNDAFYHYKGVAENAQRVEKEYAESDNPERAEAYRQEEDWRVYLLYKQYESDFKAVKERLDEAVDKTEEDLLKQEQNTLREMFLNDIAKGELPEVTYEIREDVKRMEKEVKKIMKPVNDANKERLDRKKAGDVDGMLKAIERRDSLKDTPEYRKAESINSDLKKIKEQINSLGSVVRGSQRDSVIGELQKNYDKLKEEFSEL